MFFWGTSKELKNFLEDKNIREALKRASLRFAEGRLKALSQLGDFSEVRKRLREIKEAALSEADNIWDTVGEHIRERGGFFIEARDAEDARKKILRICEENDVDFLIKGKSITSEEIMLKSFLEENGIEVIETDLGERILQLKREKPSHLIVPAIHHTKEEVAKLFSSYFGEPIPADPYIITKKVREDLRQKFITAKAGFTGINVVSCEPVAFYLMTNEGNGRLCATLPEIQIILAGWEKVVKSLEEALFLLKILPKNSVGLDFSSYVSIFTSPFLWKDGRKLFVILLDNGRRKAFSDKLLTHALRCIRCGACMNVCPVYQVLSGQGFSHVYMGGIGVAWTAITSGFDKAAEIAELCSGCGSCNNVCPVEIPISEMVSEIKARSKKKDALKEIALSIVSNKKTFSSLAEILRLFGTFHGESFNVWAKKNKLLNSQGDINFYAGCLMEQFYPETAVRAYLLLKYLGLEIALFEEVCCGLPQIVHGKKGKFFELALINLERYERRPTIFICDSCYSMFMYYKKMFPNHQIFPETISSFLLRKGFSVSLKENIKVMVHLPCHLRLWGEEKSVFEFLERLQNIEIVRDFTEAHCCGGAGLYRYKYPEVSDAIFDIKAEAIRRHSPDVIVTTCPSCYTQIEDQLRKRGLDDVKVCHLVDFLFEYGAWELTDLISPQDIRKL